MKQIDELPKSVKKTVRYINQDASFEQLIILKKYLSRAIERKEKSYIANRVNN